MMGFYGFDYDPAHPEKGIQIGSNLPVFRKKWITPENHNFDRLTRILKSLLLLGLEGEACQLWACLSRLYNTDSEARRCIDAKGSYGYWAQVMEPWVKSASDTSYLQLPRTAAAANPGSHKKGATVRTQLPPAAASVRGAAAGPLGIGAPVGFSSDAPPLSKASPAAASSTLSATAYLQIPSATSASAAVGVFSSSSSAPPSAQSFAPPPKAASLPPAGPSSGPPSIQVSAASAPLPRVVVGSQPPVEISNCGNSCYLSAGVLWGVLFNNDFIYEELERAPKRLLAAHPSLSAASQNALDYSLTVH